MLEAEDIGLEDFFEESFQKFQGKLREIFPEESMAFLREKAEEGTRDFLAIVRGDVELFLGKNDERGADYMAHGLLGIYFSLREVFSRLHMILHRCYREQRAPQWDGEEGAWLQNLLQDTRVIAVLGEILRRRENWVGDEQYISAIFGKELMKEGEGNGS